MAKYLDLTGLTRYDSKIKAYIQSAIAAAATNSFEYVVSTSAATTPNVTTYGVSEGTLAPSSDTEYHIYLVPTEEDAPNIYEEWLTLHINNSYSWEKIGTTDVDLSNYVVKVEGKGLSTNDFTDTYKEKLDNLDTSLGAKQDTLTFDNTPTANSNNPVKSGGVKSALDEKQATLVSGTNIKTINNASILGEGNIDTTDGSKLDKSAGVANAGKVMYVNSSGNIEPTDKFKYLSAPDLDLLVDAGLYVVSSPTHTPSDAGTISTAILEIEVISSTVKQTLNSGNKIFHRSIDTQLTSTTKFSDVAWETITIGAGNVLELDFNNTYYCYITEEQFKNVSLGKYAAVFMKNTKTSSMNNRIFPIYDIYQRTGTVENPTAIWIAIYTTTVRTMSGQTTWYGSYSENITEGINFFYSNGSPCAYFEYHSNSCQGKTKYYSYNLTKSNFDALYQAKLPSATNNKYLHTNSSTGEFEWASAENDSNKVTSLSSNSTDTQYPSAKCVYDLIGNIETALQTLNTGGGVVSGYSVTIHITSSYLDYALSEATLTVDGTDYYITGDFEDFDTDFSSNDTQITASSISLTNIGSVGVVRWKDSNNSSWTNLSYNDTKNWTLTADNFEIWIDVDMID